MKASILFSRIQFQGANAIAGMAIAGYPAMTAFLGYAQSVARAVAGEKDGRPLRRFAVVHHTGQPRFYGNRFNPQMTQKRGVKTDEGGESREAMWFTPAEDWRPQIDFEASLIIEVEISEKRMAEIDVKSDILRECLGHRALGGSVVGFGRATFQGDATEHLQRAGRGHAIVDMKDMLWNADGDSLDILMDRLSDPYQAGCSDRYFATHVGYAALEDPVCRPSGRGEAEHVYAEPILSLAAFRRTYEVDEDTPLMWRPTFDRERGIYVLQGEKI